jgi:effector-binding domain-containing protein
MAMTVSTLAADPPAEKKAPAAAGAAEFLVGEMQVQNLPEMNYVYGSAETTFEKIGDVVNKYIPMLTKGLVEGQLRSGGCAMFIYKGVTEDMSKPFTLEIGWCVPPEAKAFGELKARKVKAAKCATMLYTGSLANIAKIYEKLMPAVKAAGLTPTGDAREMYLYWENPESANNVIQVVIEVK